MHFAAHTIVQESVEIPLMYYATTRAVHAT